jgi:transcriptional regulator with AbiEi antitoxin domain of type IV toxin-antitoxin system
MVPQVKLENGAAIEARVVDVLRELLPTFRITRERQAAQATWDVAGVVRSGRTTRQILIECKSVGEPRYLAQAITRLTLARHRLPRAYPVVAAPYIGPAGQRLCRDAEVGYIDLVGNALLRFDSVLIDRRSAERPVREKSRLKRLFSPKSSRVLRVLLEKPEIDWTLARLAAEAEISLRTAHLVINALEEKVFVDKRRGAIRLRQPGALLDLWGENYRVDEHRRLTYYSFIRNPRELAATLTSQADARKDRLALTLHSGAALVAPFVRSADVHAYFRGDVERLVKAADLRPVESGGSVHLLVPNDEGVFYRTQTVDHVPVVCNTQLYLDLLHYPARGREQAEELRRQKLRY